MVEELISEYIDLDATGRQTEAFLAQLKEIEAKYEKLNSIKLNLGDASGTKQVVTSMKEAASATGELKTSIEGMSVSATEAAKSNATVAKSNAELVKSSRDANAAISDEAKANTVLKKSQADLTAELIRNKTERQAITSQKSELMSKVTSGELQFPDEESFKSYQKTIVALTKAEEELKQEGLELSRAVRNIAKESINAEGSLNQLRAQLNLSVQLFDALGEADRNSDVGKELTANIKELTKEISAQEQSTGRFQRNVGNYSGAVKVLEKSLDSVNKKLKQNQSENKLSAAAVEMLQKEQALLETFLERQDAAFANSSQEIKENTKQLELLAAAGLQSSESYKELFATTSALKDEAADLKAALKNAAPDDVALNAATDAAKGLVGVYGLAQSASALFGVENDALAETMVKLQAAETALQSIEAIRAVFKKENAIFQAKEILAGKVLLVQKTLEGAAESKNIVIRYGAIAAQKALNVVTQAAGGPLLIIIGVVAALIPLLLSWTSANEDTAKSLTQVNAEMDKQISLLDDYNESVSQSSDIAIANLRANFAAEKDIRSAQIELIRNQLRETAIFLTENRRNFENAQERLSQIAHDTKRKGQTSLTEEQKKEVEELTAIRDKFQSAEKRRDELETQREVAVADNRRASIEEEIKVRQDSIEIINKERDNRIQILQDIANNEEKSYDERIAALNAFVALQKKVSQDAAKAALLDESLTPSERRKIRNAQIIEEKTLERQRSTQISDLRKQEAERQRAALIEIAQNELNYRAEINAQIAADENKSFAQRSDALAAEQQDRVALIKAGAAAEIAARKNILPEERAAIEKKANIEILNLRSAFLLRLQDLNNQALFADQENNERISNRRRDELLKQLADEYGAGLIAKEDYEEQRFNIESRYAKQSLQLLINSTRRQLEVAGISNEARKKLLADLAAYELELSNQTNDDAEAKEEAKYQKRVKRVNQFGELSKGVGDIISELSSIGTDRRLAEIDSEINALEKKKQKEIEIANASITNAQDRAAAITTIEARANAEREALERRKRQVQAQQAKTERLITVGRIIADTAAAVVTTLGDKTIQPAFLRIPLAATIGALGLAQLTRVLAAPLPQFKKGKNKDDNYEGYAWVGDGGKKEMHISDGKATITPDTPTLTYVKRNDIILPDADQAMRDLAHMSFKPVPRNPVPVQSNFDMISAFKKGNRELVNAIKSKKELEIKGSHAAVIAIHKHAQERWNYINENTNF